jgi:hypothetical protein
MDVLTNALLRPYRSSYSLTDLGPKKTALYTRNDRTTINNRELKIQYSYYEQHTASEVCLIYCHCNSGSRIEGKLLI